MNSNNGKIVLILGLIFASASSMFVNGQLEGTTIADYRLGGLINIPTFLTQPYFLAAKQGCPIVDRPICGADGKTYQNECFLKLACINKAYDGWCIGSKGGKDATPAQEVDPLAENEATGFLRFGTPTTGACPCNDNYYPVCTEKGLTYANLCRAKCNGEKAVQVGQCYNFYYKPQIDAICKCAFTKEPVCATNNVTYENSCVMICAGATFKALQVCAAPCNCAFVYKPVCGVDGKNYINDCELRCNKVQRAFEGRCESGPIQKCIYCIGDLSPVCGTDGKSYDNICYLKCNKTEVQSQGRCLPPSPTGQCVCPTIFLPVCSTEGKTFDNECNAKCNNQQIAYNGVCKPKPKKNHHKNTGTEIDSCLQGCAVHGSDPVCGSDGRTYGNECATTCNSVLLVKIIAKKSCKVVTYDHCPCNTEFKPVCGVDGKTYLNICTIQCVGINKAWDGPCGVIGNYGYIMSEYYTNGTGAGPAAPVIIVPEKKVEKCEEKKEEEKHEEPKTDSPRWATQQVKVVYITNNDDEHKMIVGDGLGTR